MTWLELSREIKIWTEKQKTESILVYVPLDENFYNIKLEFDDQNSPNFVLED